MSTASAENPRQKPLLLRVALLHPIGFVAPPAALAWVLSRLPDSSVGYVDWAFWAIPLAGFASLAMSVVTILRSEQPATNRVALIGIGLTTSILFTAAAMAVWYDAAVVA